MKTSLISSIVFVSIILIGCKAQEQRVSGEVYTKEGVIIFSPTLNATYFFPFKNHQLNLDLSEFINQEYDTGFTVTWYQAKWRDEVLDNYSMPISDNTFKTAAYVAVEYAFLKSFAGDSLYSFNVEYSGTNKNFIYDDKAREFTNIRGLE